MKQLTKQEFARVEKLLECLAKISLHDTLHDWIFYCLKQEDRMGNTLTDAETQLVRGIIRDLEKDYTKQIDFIHTLAERNTKGK